MTDEMDDKLQKEENLTKEVDSPVKSPSPPPECVVCATTSPETSYKNTSRTKLGALLLGFVQKLIKPGWEPENHPKCVTICKPCLDSVNNLEEVQMKLKIHGDESTDSDADCEWGKGAISNVRPSKRSKKKRPNNKVKDDTLSQDLEREREKAEGNTTHSCNTCKRKYSRFSYGRDLIKENRSDEPRDCSMCQRIFIPRTFKRRKPLTNKKPFGCLICKRRFIEEMYLQQHLKYHTRQIPYQCHACELKFDKRHEFLGHLWDCKPCVCGIKCFQVLEIE